MSATGKIGFDWGDGFHEFRLPIGQMIELQRLTDAGPEELRHRIAAGTWRVQDLRETIRLGLIGGGMKPDATLPLMRQYFDERPYAENVRPALAILTAALVGVPDDPPKAKEKKPGKKRRGASRPDSSPPASSTAPAPSSASRRGKSTK